MQKYTGIMIARGLQRLDAQDRERWRLDCKNRLSPACGDHLLGSGIEGTTFLEPNDDDALHSLVFACDRPMLLVFNFEKSDSVLLGNNSIEKCLSLVFHKVVMYKMLMRFMSFLVLSHYNSTVYTDDNIVDNNNTVYSKNHKA